MKLSLVYDLAADDCERYLHDHPDDDYSQFYACDAICYAGCHWATQNRARNLFAEYFKPPHRSAGGAWFGKRNTKNAGRRILALRFMAEIARSEGR